MEKLFTKNGDQLSVNLTEYNNKLDENQLFGIQSNDEFIGMNQYVFNSQNLLNYDISQVVSLKEYLASLLKSGESNHFKGYSAIIKQIVNIMLIGDKLFFASPQNIVLDIDHIYISLADRSVKFMYFPFATAYNTEELRVRFGILMESFYPFLGDSSDSLVLQSRVMQFLKNEDADFRVLRSQIDKWETGIAGESKARSQMNSQSRETGTIADHEEDVKTSKKADKNSGKTKTQSREVQSVVKAINPKVIISVVLVQVVIIAIISLIYFSGALVDAETGAFNVTQFIGASLILAVLLEYVMYKGVFENKDIYIEKVKTTTVNYGGQTSTPKEAKPKKEAKAPKAKKSKKNVEPVVVEELESAIEGTDLLVDPLEEMEEAKTSLLDDIPVSAYLHIRKGTIVQKFELNQSITSIGRKAGINCVVQEKSISGHHATIHNQNGVFYIEDENSTNHTYLNGTLLEPKNLKRIESNDRLKLANVEMTFTIE